jgi:hypothetical protein
MQHATNKVKQQDEDVVPACTGRVGEVYNLAESEVCRYVLSPCSAFMQQKYSTKLLRGNMFGAARNELGEFKGPHNAALADQSIHARPSHAQKLGAKTDRYACNCLTKLVLLCPTASSTLSKLHVAYIKSICLHTCFHIKSTECFYNKSQVGSCSMLVSAAD